MQDNVQVFRLYRKGGVHLVIGNKHKLLRTRAEMADTLLRKVAVIKQRKAYGRLLGKRAFVYAHLLLNTPAAQRPEIGGLFNIVVLLQTLFETVYLRKIAVNIHVVGAAGADFAVERCEQKQSSYGS